VGRIASVNLTTSKVILVGDPNCSVGALVSNDARDAGIVGESGPLDHSLVEMNYISRTATLKPGQEVVTSGTGGIFTKKGIRIGIVADAREAQFGLYKEAHVKLAVNLSALEEVWVVMP
jgi:cell shape-determining protein MreC